MRIRTGLALVSLVWVSGSLAIVACSSSSTSSGGGAPDSGHAGSGSGSSSGSGSGSRDAGGSAPTDAEGVACGASANALCALMAQCNPLVFASDFGDSGACVGRELTNCELAITAPNSGASTDHTVTCASVEATEGCAQYLDLTPPDACAQVAGTTANGGACGHPGQCATGFCAIAPGAACGTCAAVPTAGASCTELTTCGPDLDCYKGTCVAFVTAANGACSATAPCGSGLGCVIPTGSTSGMCQALGATMGAACDPKSETAAVCDSTKGLSCVDKITLATYKTCQPELAATAGMPCGYVEGIQNYCVNATCNNPNDAGFNCVARAAEGQVCNSLVGPECTTPARCVGTKLDGGASGTCQVQAACP